MLYRKGSCWVYAGFAKQLERQRDEARELLAKALERGDEAIESANKARKELEWSDIQDKRELVRERDEALDLARELRDALGRLLPYIEGDRIAPWRPAVAAINKAKEAGL